MTMEYYSKTRGRTTMKGEWFEVKTAALLYLRGINANLEFHLGSNIEQARNFDDIVIKYRSRDDGSNNNNDAARWRTCFIQLKHKERAWLDASMLTSYDRGGFSLKKYLKSFSEIKSKVSTRRDHDLFDGPFETCDFVIYTNAPMVRDLARRSRNVDIGPVEELLKTSQQNEVIVGFCEEIDRDIYRELEMSGGSEAKEFLHKLKVFSGQPSEDRMDEVIKQELKVTCSDNMSDVDVIYRFFIEAVKQWWSEDEVNFLSHNSSLLEKALDQYKVFTISSHEKQTYRLNVRFKTTALEDLKRTLNTNYSVCSVVCGSTPAELVCTKVMQILRGERGAYTFVGLESLVGKRQAVVHGWSTGPTSHLVVLCNLAGEHAELCREMCDVLRKNVGQHALVVVASGPDDAFVWTLRDAAITSGVKFIETKDSTELAELDRESIDRILDSPIYLQSRKMTIRGVLRKGVDDADDVIKHNLVQIMASTPVSIGRDLEDSINVCTRRYLERRDVIHVDLLNNTDQVSGVIAVSNVSLTNLKQVVPAGTRIGTLDESMNGPVRVVAIQSRCNAANVTEQDFSGTEQDFHTLCAHHHVVHWISIENDVILWKRSKGDVATIRPFVVQETCTGFNPNSTLDLNDRILLIVEETPPTQKSSLAGYLAMQTKKTHPYFWVLKVNLNEHVDLLRETKFEEDDLVSFLMEASCMDTNFRLEREFLQFCLRYSRNVIVLMEHFNETPEDCHPSVVECVKRLLLTRVFQVLVTTPSSKKDMLEDGLCTFAYNARDLSLTRDVQKLLQL